MYEFSDLLSHFLGVLGVAGGPFGLLLPRSIDFTQ